MKWIALGLGVLAAAAGCKGLAPRAVEVLPVEQPMTFEKAPYDIVWDATMVALKARFPIYTWRKESGDIRTGFEITYGQFEFWRDNSASRRDRWENTIHTVRRRARADVQETDAGVQVTLVVEKERRDRAQEGARFSFADSASIFNPEINALDRGLRDPTAPEWLPLGRDTKFESLLLAEIRRRVGQG